MKQCWTDEENLPLCFQAKHFLKELSNKEPALWHGALQWVSNLAALPGKEQLTGCHHIALTQEVSPVTA